MVKLPLNECSLHSPGWMQHYCSIFPNHRIHPLIHHTLHDNNIQSLKLYVMTSSNGNFFRVILALCAGNSPVTGEYPAQRPVTRSSDVDLRLNKRLSKQSWCCWLETPSRSLWRQCNVSQSRWYYIANGSLIQCVHHYFAWHSKIPTPEAWWLYYHICFSFIWSAWFFKCLIQLCT